MRDKILTIFFILLITSQLYGLVLAPGTTLQEKRKFAEIPEFKTASLIEGSFYSKLGKFLDDRYPYRSTLIIVKNWIDFYIFKTSPSPKVHIGTDGWLYLKKGMSSYLKNDCKKKQKAQNLARELYRVEKYLASINKKFFFIVAPDKATIYPEHVGMRRARSTCGMSFYDLFLEALDEYPLQGFIRLDQILVDAKSDSQIYYQKGTHWNDRGALLVSRTILQRLSAESAIYNPPEIKFKEIERTQDLAALFALNLKEKTYIAGISRKDNNITIKSLPPFLGKRSFHLKLTNNAAAGTLLLPRTIIYQDSFLNVPLNMIAGSFEEIDAIWTPKVLSKPEIDFYALRASKIVIVEVIERSLDDVQFNEKALKML
ncbi:MAG: hypothetical protein ACE5DW_03815 [Thermodesulfobacteriota bacterium]